MVENVVHPRKDLFMDGITTTDILLGLSDPEFFPETFDPNSEIESSSNEEQYPNQIQQYNSSSTQDHINGKTGRPPDPIFDETGPTIHLNQDMSASVDFISMSPAFATTPELESQSNQELYSMASINNHNHQFSLGDQIVSAGDNIYSHDDQWPALAAPPTPQPVVPIRMGPAIPSHFDEGLSSNMTPPPPPSSSYMTLSNSSLMDPNMIMHCVSMPPQYSSGNSGICAGMFRNHDIFSQQDLDFQGERGVPFLPHDNMQRYLNCTSDQLQALSSESQHLVHGGSSRSTTPLSSEITGFEDPSFKAAGKLSVEERMRKVDRYRAKRNERNFSKKIKYACRKTLADSRPRVRGRFAKNDEPGELTRIINGGNQEDEVDDHVSAFSNNSVSNLHWGKIALALKEEDDTAYGADPFSHISAVNSFKCNYPNNHGFDR